MDDVLIFRPTRQEHDARLIAALKHIQAAGTTLNPKKCDFRISRVKFLGHLIDMAHGIQADPEKVSVTLKMESPQNVFDLLEWQIN